MQQADIEIAEMIARIAEGKSLASAEEVAALRRVIEAAKKA